jgi:hypothetical protein
MWCEFTGCCTQPTYTICARQTWDRPITSLYAKSVSQDSFKSLINYLNLVLEGSLEGPIYLRNMPRWLLLPGKESCIWLLFIRFARCQTVFRAAFRLYWGCSDLSILMWKHNYYISQWALQWWWHSSIYNIIVTIDLTS